MTPSALHARMLELFQRYKDALAAHELGRGLLVREEAATLLACEWETVLAALDEWAEGDRPLSYGTLPEDLAETRGTTVGYGHDYSIEDEPAASDTYGDWRDNEPLEPGASA